jgi:hypothetical protein
VPPVFNQFDSKYPENAYADTFYGMMANQTASNMKAANTLRYTNS